MKAVLPIALLLSVVSACNAPPKPATEAADMDAIAREYLFLELSMGRHDENHVDAYFGPAEIRREADAADLSLADVSARAAALRASLIDLQAVTPAATDPARIAGLLGRLMALDTRIAINQGEKPPFDEESMRLFGAVAPDRDAAYFESVLAEIDALLGGEGPLPERVAAFKNRFVIPPDRLAAVFEEAIAECRKRTLAHIALPADESFSIEYVSDKPWSGYNWYQGDAHSLIQVNTDLPVFISRAVDLGCHEGYPGHHTYNALLETNLVRGKGWLEYSLYPLFSPQSLIAEGSGNYGIELAFPGDERIRYERDVLFPLAGLDAGEADRYYALLALLGKLDYAGNEAARDYLNGAIDRDQAIDWLVRFALMEPDRARQRTDFFDTYRSYVINYNLGRDLVRRYVERGGAAQEERWRRFSALLSSPMAAGDLD